MFNITIPKPCHEGWENMLPNQQGRHCNACAKTVIDFTGMSDAAVKEFFIAKKEEQVCGRFKDEQLHRIVVDLPENILYIAMPLWKKFLAACLIIFSSTLFSCDTTINGEPSTGKLLMASSVNQSLWEATPRHGTVGMAFTFTKSAIQFTPDTASYCGVTYGNLVPAWEDSSAAQKIINLVSDAVLQQTVDTANAKVFADSAWLKQMAAAKKNNPPKADSIDCNTQIYY